MNQFESLEIYIIVGRHNLSMVLMILQDKNMIGQLEKGCFFLFDENFYFSIASEKQPDADNKNKIAFGRSDWLHEFKLSANWLKTTERYVPEIYYPKKGFHFDTRVEGAPETQKST